MEVGFVLFLDKQKNSFSTTVKLLSDKNNSNQFYIYISVVDISYIYLFGDFILSLIKVYSMW